MRLLDEILKPVFASKESWNQQKIFRGTLGGSEIAWAVSGPVYSWDCIAFNLVNEIHGAMGAASGYFPESALSQYSSVLLGLFSSALHSSLCDIEKKGAVVFKDSTEPFATIFMAGYFGYGGMPVNAAIRLSHRGGAWLEPELIMRNPPQEMFAGPKAIYESYIGNSEDVRFTKYAHPGGATLDDGLARAKGFIEACCDPIAAEIDPGIQDRIGGHIHAAAVTPSGFRWLIEPKPEGAA
jgi:hypothetical protein